MAGKVKKLALFLPLGLAASLFLLVLLVDSWLESSAGRKKLETALAESLGMPVKLQGEFNIALLPALGVSGTDLLIGSSDSGQAFLHSGDYHVAVKLLPLIDGELSVLSFSVSDGLLNPAHYPAVEVKAVSSGNAKLRLPEIERFTLEEIRIILPGRGDNSVLIDSLELEAFRAGDPSDLRLELGLQSSGMRTASLSVDSKLLVESDLSQLSLDFEALNIDSGAITLRGINGSLSWHAARQIVQGQFSWQESGLGSAALVSHLSTSTTEGRVEFSYTGEGQSQTLSALLDFEQHETGLFFPQIVASFGTQQASGNGCFLTGENGSLHLSMASDFIDLEVLESLYPGEAGFGSGAGEDLPVELNVKLIVQEIHAAGAVVRDAEISLGQEPDCDRPPEGGEK
jgi:hypothetical protein